MGRLDPNAITQQYHQGLDLEIIQNDHHTPHEAIHVDHDDDGLPPPFVAVTEEDQDLSEPPPIFVNVTSTKAQSSIQETTPYSFPPPPDYNETTAPHSFPPPPDYNETTAPHSFPPPPYHNETPAPHSFPPPISSPPILVMSSPPPLPVFIQTQNQLLTEQAWKTSLFGCMSDPLNAIITLCCPCVTFGQIAEIVDSGNSSCGSNGKMYEVIAICIGMPCIMSCKYRTKMRIKFRLIESPAPDWVVHCFCECCALSQEYRELKERDIDPSIGWHGNVAKQQQKQQFAMAPPIQEMMCDVMNRIGLLRIYYI